MALTTPRYWLKADAGRTSPVNAVTESGALTGGTVTLTEISTGVWAYRCTGSNSSATFTALTTSDSGGGTFNTPDGPRTWAIRAAINVNPTSGSMRLFGFTATADLDSDGTKVVRFGDTQMVLRSPQDLDQADAGAAFSLPGSTVLKTIVVKLAPSSPNTLRVWVQRTDRAGATTPDFVSSGNNYSEALMAFGRFIVQPVGGTLDIADAVLWQEGDLTDAECAAVADNLRTAMEPPADTTAPTITGPSAATGSTSAVSVAENTTAVHTFTASESVTWSLNGGADVARFSINSSTGALAFLAAPNFEAPTDADTNNTYIVGVRATDGSSNATTQTVTVTVTDVAEGGATAVTLSGPASGVNGVASTNFTVGANGTITGTVTVTPSSGGGGGTFTPTSVNISSGTPTATFVYTPASTGAKSISVTNGGGLSNPSAVTYTVSAAPTTYSITVGDFGLNTGSGPLLGTAVSYTLTPGEVGAASGASINGTGTLHATTGMLTITGLAAAGVYSVQVKNADGSGRWHDVATAA